MDHAFLLAKIAAEPTKNWGLPSDHITVYHPQTWTKNDKCKSILQFFASSTWYLVSMWKSVPILLLFVKSPFCAPEKPVKSSWKTTISIFPSETSWNYPLPTFRLVAVMVTVAAPAAFAHMAVMRPMGPAPLTKTWCPQPTWRPKKGWWVQEKTSKIYYKAMGIVCVFKGIFNEIEWNYYMGLS